MSKINLKDKTLSELKDIFINLNEKSFRAKQVYKWIHQKNINLISDITVLSKDLRDKLEKDYELSNMTILKRLDSKQDKTKKYLFLLKDKNIIESVMMKHKHGVTLCLSTQVGCRMGCEFCASTKDGLIRNLTAGEILDQVYQIENDLNIDVSNIVLMGSGEPLDNYENVLKFLKMINSKDGHNIGFRHITLSTCGVVGKIYELANENIPITLSISLHSPYNDERKKIIPIAKKYNIEELINACKYYIEKTNRRISFEYTLIEGVNDRKKDAYKIAEIIKGMLAHVNLIPLNDINETNFNKSNNKNVIKFKNILLEKGINATVRKEMGSDINAACGQLRRDYLRNKDN
ncbi:MAG: 23S rRNA (adenine(2503)-C(2))-methyltransferase RlmN [Firmicutes bacterium]|nr:23S rRNA (adenine(2503)-C(2))-methyltransferase RlmN [Bacillota bacterium]